MENITWKYVKALGDNSSVDKFEKSNNFRFPKDLKDYLIKFNGGRPSSKYYDLGEDKDKEFKTLLSFNKDDTENIYKFYPIDSSDKSIVPFASDPAGNFFVIKDNKIGLWNHESDSTTILANSFLEFLTKLHD